VTVTPELGHVGKKNRTRLSTEKELKEHAIRLHSRPLSGNKQFHDWPREEARRIIDQYLVSRRPQASLDWSGSYLFDGVAFDVKAAVLDVASSNGETIVWCTLAGTVYSGAPNRELAWDIKRVTEGRGKETPEAFLDAVRKWMDQYGVSLYRLFLIPPSFSPSFSLSDRAN
jgi:hypothetical protein